MRPIGIHLLIGPLLVCLPACAPSPPPAPETAASATRPATRNLAATTHPAFRVRIPPSVCEIGFIRIAGGTVEVPPITPDGRPRTVQVAPFCIAQTETTQEAILVWALALDIPLPTVPILEQFPPRRYQVMEARTGCSVPPYNGYIFGGTRPGDTLPAGSVTWQTAIAYCQWLSQQTGRKFRLPTEAEWQLAALEGSPATRPITPAGLAEVAWFRDNADEMEHTVGQLAPNRFGLYDMLGNVGEWALMEDGDYCLKGGSYTSSARHVHAAARLRYSPAWQIGDPFEPKNSRMYTDAPFAGFRMVCEE